MALVGTSFFIETAVFWVVAPCRLVEVYWRFRGACCLLYQGDEGVFTRAYHWSVTWASYIQMAVFLDVATCSLVDIDWPIALMIEAVRSSETSVSIYRTAIFILLTLRTWNVTSYIQFTLSHFLRSVFTLSPVCANGVISPRFQTKNVWRCLSSGMFRRIVW
jgi:hypothetical protein